MKIIEQKPDPDAWVIGAKQACYNCKSVAEFDESDRARYDWDPGALGAAVKKLRWQCPICHSRNILTKGIWEIDNVRRPKE